MSIESRTGLATAHVLFMDVVGYSRLLSDRQRELFRLLNELVRRTAAFQEAEAADKLVRLPTGDGMVLAFFTNVDAPVRCAQELARALQSRPQLPLRMGINSGPVDEVSDVNDRRNVTGAGINIAQRVMDCGDAGHILLSKRVADDLAQYSEWQTYLHGLGEVEVKHGVRLALTNFYGEEFGNPARPSKIRQAKKIKRRRVSLWVVGAMILSVLAVVAGWAWTRRAALTSAYEAGAAGIAEKSIAVLPFDNFGDKDNAYFADGVQDSILTDLAKVAELKVISRRSVAQYRGSTLSIRDIGRALQVAYVLEGTVQKASGKIHLTAQLIDTRTEAEKWGEKFERDVSDVFAIQNQISQTIVTQLKAAISPAEKSALSERPTQDEQAYDLYLRARALVRQPFATVKAQQGDVPKAVTLLESAIARDPKFTLAYCLLSEAQLNLFNLQFYNYEQLPKAKEAADKALEISPQSGEAHLALAQYFYQGLHDRPGAARELATTATFLPGDVNVFNLGADIAEEDGNWNKALRDRRRAAELDPRDADTAVALVRLYTWLRHYADAEKIISQMIAGLPQQISAPFWRWKGRIELAKGDTRAAMAAYDAHPLRNTGLISLTMEIANVFFLQRQYEKAAELLRSAEDVARARNILPEGGENPSVRGTRLFQLGRIARFSRQPDQARSCFETARQNSEAWQTKNPQQATIYEARAAALIAADDAGLGRKEDALREAQQLLTLWPVTRNAVVAGEIAPIVATAFLWAGDRETAFHLLEQFSRVPNGPSEGELKLNPTWDELRKDPRFNALATAAAKPIPSE